MCGLQLQGDTLCSETAITLQMDDSTMGGLEHMDAPTSKEETDTAEVACVFKTVDRLDNNSGVTDMTTAEPRLGRTPRVFRIREIVLLESTV